jgi:hypothetical protein
MTSLFRPGTTPGKLTNDLRENRAIQSHNFRSHAATQASITTVRTVEKGQGGPSGEATSQNGTIRAARDETRGITPLNSPSISG